MRPFVLAAAVILLALVGWWFIHRGNDGITPSGSTDAITAPVGPAATPLASGAAPAQAQQTGAIAAETAVKPPTPATVAPPAPTAPVPSAAGITPSADPVAASVASAAPTSSATAGAPPTPDDLTPAQKSVQEALTTGKHPERLGPMIQPTPLDRDRWAKDAAYAKQWLDTVEPGRVYQPAQPGPDVLNISKLGDEDRFLPDGGFVELAVQVGANQPVTFNSFDSGQFDQTHLSTVSLVSCEDGIARVTFRQSPGCVGRCRILAASPFTSGQAQFTVTFADPKKQ